MLRRLKVHNFKTWKSAELQLGTITGLFGANSSGKTSLIQFLLLLKQTKEATDRGTSLQLNGPYVTLGVYRDVIHAHDENLALRWEIAFQPEEEVVINDLSPPARGAEISVSSRVVAREQGPKAQHLEYKVGENVFSLARRGRDDHEFELSGTVRFIRRSGGARHIPGPIKAYAFPDQVRTSYQNASFLSDLEALYEDQVDRLYYLGPLRLHPQRDYLWAGSRPLDVGPRGETTIDAILGATAARELRSIKKGPKNKQFQDVIAHWLSAMGVIQTFHIVEIAKGSNRWQAKVRVQKGGPEVLLPDVGFGVSQVLPVITLLQYVPEGSTVILEQPEIHLHPLAQAHLADVIISAALYRRLQVVLESHSEHLLLRLLRRVAEEEISNEDVKLYFCNVVDSVSKLERLKLDKYGRIQNWPEKFMGDAFGEAYAAEEKRLTRMAAAE